MTTPGATTALSAAPAATTMPGRAHRPVDQRPVTLLLDSDDLPAEVLQFGYEEAARRGTTLRVVRAGRPEPDDHPDGAASGEPAWQRYEQTRRLEQLDLELSTWSGTPEVGVVAELVQDTVPHVARAVQADSQLLVLATPTATQYLSARTGVAAQKDQEDFVTVNPAGLAEIVGHLDCPLVIVPTQTTAGEGTCARSTS